MGRRIEHRDPKTAEEGKKFVFNERIVNRESRVVFKKKSSKKGRAWSSEKDSKRGKLSQNEKPRLRISTDSYNWQLFDKGGGESQSVLGNGKYGKWREGYEAVRLSLFFLTGSGTLGDKFTLKISLLYRENLTSGSVLLRRKRERVKGEKGVCSIDWGICDPVWWGSKTGAYLRLAHRNGIGA